jgi:hypothetical protein
MEKQDFIKELDGQIAALEQQLSKLKEKRVLLDKLEVKIVEAK